MPTIDLVLPTVTRPRASSLVLAPRPANNAPLRLLLVDNGKPRASEILRFLAEAMADDLQVVAVNRHVKTSASVVLSAEEAADLAERNDVALTGLGDCGGCSAGSMQDALTLERAGIPATVVVTEPFQGLVTQHAERLGAAAGHPTIVLPHPVATKDVESLRLLAQRTASLAVRHLTRVAS